VRITKKYAFMSVGVLLLASVAVGLAAEDVEDGAGPPEGVDPFIKRVVPWKRLRELRGKEFVQECRLLVEPMHAPDFDPDELCEVLCGRLPTLGPEERSAALAALASWGRCDRSGKTLVVLERLWRDSEAGKRTELVAPLVSAMEGVEKYDLREEILRHLAGCKLSEFGSEDFRWVQRLLRGPRADGQLPDHLAEGIDGKLCAQLGDHLAEQIKGGAIHRLALAGALSFAKVLGQRDEDVLIMCQTCEGTQRGARFPYAERPELEVETLRKIADRPPNAGAVKLCELFLSDRDEQVAREANNAYHKLVKAGAEAETDAFYLGLFRVGWGGDQTVLPGTDRYAERGELYQTLEAVAVRYFKAQAAQDLKGSVERLRKAGVSFSQDELQRMSKRGVPEEFVKAFRK